MSITKRKMLFGAGAGAVVTVLPANALAALAEAPQAVPLTWRTWSEVCELRPGLVGPHNPGRCVATVARAFGESPPFIELTVPTPDGPVVARHGDLIVRDSDGGLHVVEVTPTPAAEASA